MDGSILTNFGMVMHLGFVDPISQWNLVISKSNMAAVSHLENGKITLSQKLIDQFSEILYADA